jgi:hypothetical protein
MDPEDSNDPRHLLGMDLTVRTFRVARLIAAGDRGRRQVTGRSAGAELASPFEPQQ